MLLILVGILFACYGLAKILVMKEISFKEVGGVIIVFVIGFVSIILGLIFLNKRTLEVLIESTDERMENKKNVNVKSLIFNKTVYDKGPNIVVIGGGTGLNTVLSGLKNYTNNLTAIVTISDYGEAASNSRKELQMLPLGDVKDSIVSLASKEGQIDKLFNYEFTTGKLRGLNFSDIYFSAMRDINGNFEDSIIKSNEVLNMIGKVIPVTLDGMLVRSTSFLNKHMVRKNHNISVDELSHALELTDKAELSEENNILEGIIRFGGETAKEVMTSRLDVVDLDIRTPFKDVVKCIVENVYSRIPIYADSRDNIKGVLYIKDLLPHLNKGDNFRWQSLIRPAYFVPETKMIDDLLRDFQANKIHIAIVVDEFGGTSGIVTMEDIIEEIVGEIHDEYDDEERTYAVLNDHTWVFEAKTQLTDFYKITKIDEETFDEVAGDADTLAGLLLELKGEFPALHEKVTYGRYEFEVLEMDNRRILKVKFTVNAPAEPNSSSL